MSLPDEVRVEIRSEGLIFEFRVRALAQGCALLFPGSPAADEFLICPHLSGEVVRVAASVLDAAAFRFAGEFGAALSAVLARKLDKEYD